MSLAVRQERGLETSQGFSHDQIDILKNSICRGVSDDEFKIFLMACQKTQLDPFMRQIYAVKRKSKKPDGSWGETMTIQTGIDGFRLIAERTEKYAPGPKPTYEYDENGKLISATAYVKKLTKDGTWHIVEAEAHFDEYVQTYNDKQSGEKKSNDFWTTKGRIMLAKCAESLALRKAFPAEMSGIYTKEEMEQANTLDATPKPLNPTLSPEQADELKMILDECETRYQDWFYDTIKKQYQTDNLNELPVQIFQRMKTAATKNMEENHSKQRQEFSYQEQNVVEVQ
jgi:phage recombination protein Bet